MRKVHALNVQIMRYHGEYERLMSEYLKLKTFVKEVNDFRSSSAQIAAAGNFKSPVEAIKLFPDPEEPYAICGQAVSVDEVKQHFSAVQSQ